MTENKTIAFLQKEQCTGCMLCGDCCPKAAISFYEDSEGFKYPKVDEATCISCGICVKNCPALSPLKNDSAENSFAVFATDESKREAGSSGGVFGLLAEGVLNKCGRVWGAAFDNQIHLVHTKADNADELKPLLKSKYIQSDLSGVYRQIKQDLREGRYTLFCGTPCQVNALKNFVGNKRDHLILVDFVCHGVPSQSLFDKTIKWYEKKNGKKVEWFQFRYKSADVKHPQSYAIKHTDGNKIRLGLHYQFPYYFGFQKYITLRPSCYQCKWACSERAGDITLGDYWGIEKYASELNAKEGVSMILCNTDVGKSLFQQIVNSGKVSIVTLPIQCAINENGCLKNPSKEKAERKLFFQHLQEWDFDKVVQVHLTPKKKWIFDLYYGMPKALRNVVRKLMDKRMKYE